MNQKLLISTYDFQDFHPANCAMDSDSYYARLATRLGNHLREYLSPDYDTVVLNTARQAGAWLAAYLEDKVSGLNIFNGFVKSYQKLTGLTFPFWNVDPEELFDDEPNEPEVRFLIWICSASMNEGTFYSPLAESLHRVSESVMPLLMEAFEEAPEAEKLRNWLYDTKRYEDPIAFRTTCDWIAHNAYLTRINDSRCIEEVASQMDAFLKNMPSPTAAVYQMRVYLTMNAQIGPLSMIAPHWLASVIELGGGDDCVRLAAQFREVEGLRLMVYKVIEAGENTIRIAAPTGEELVMSTKSQTKDSLQGVKAGGYLVGALYKYRDQWHANGAVSYNDDSAPIENNFKVMGEDIKNLQANRADIVEANGGKLVGAVASVKELEERFGKYTQFGESATECSNLLYFIEPDGDLTVITDAAECVDFEGNPFYSPEKSAAEGLNLLVHPITTLADREYMIANNMLPEISMPGLPEGDTGRKWMHDNELFLALCTNSPSVLFNFTAD